MYADIDLRVKRVHGLEFRQPELCQAAIGVTWNLAGRSMNVDAWNCLPTGCTKWPNGD